MHFLLSLLQSLKLFIHSFHFFFKFLIIYCAYYYLWFFLWFWNLFRFFRLRRSLKLWFIKSSSFELSLSHKSFVLDPFWIIIRTFASIFEVHKSFKGDNPCPFFVGVPSTEVKHILKGSDLEACRNHILFLPKITFISFDLSEVDELRQFLKISVREDKYIVHCKDHPSFSPLLEKLCPFVDRSFSNFMILEFALNYFWVHNININFILRYYQFENSQHIKQYHIISSIISWILLKKLYHYLRDLLPKSCSLYHHL